MSALLKHKYTLEEYYALELNSEEKFEYWDGNVWTMSGASVAHNIIVKNLISCLDERLEAHRCSVYPSGMRIYVPAYSPYRYPDLSALCGKPTIRTLGGLEILINPQLIVEVLSDSTEAFDRGDKFTYYKSIPGFNEYLLVSQKRPHVSQFIKQSETAWTQTEFNDLEATVELNLAGCRLSLYEIYRDVVFENEPFSVVGRNNDPTDAF